VLLVELLLHQLEQVLVALEFLTEFGVTVPVVLRLVLELRGLLGYNEIGLDVSEFN